MVGIAFCELLATVGAVNLFGYICQLTPGPLALIVLISDLRHALDYTKLLHKHFYLLKSEA